MTTPSELAPALAQGVLELRQLTAHIAQLQQQLQQAQSQAVERQGVLRGLMQALGEEVSTLDDWIASNTHGLGELLNPAPAAQAAPASKKRSRKKRS